MRYWVSLLFLWNLSVGFNHVPYDKVYSFVVHLFFPHIFHRKFEQRILKRVAVVHVCKGCRRSPIPLFYKLSLCCSLLRFIRSHKIWRSEFARLFIRGIDPDAWCKTKNPSLYLFIFTKNVKGSLAKMNRVYLTNFGESGFRLELHFWGEFFNRLFLSWCKAQSWIH